MARKKSTSKNALIRNAIYPFLSGEKTPVGVRPRYNKESFIHSYNNGYRSSITNAKLEAHYSGKITLYGYGSPSVKCESLCMIDHDVGKKLGLGTPEGAKSFADYVATEVIHGCPHELSTNGEGQHGYFYVTGYGDQRRRYAYEHLEKVLQGHAELIGADIEKVEVKGKPPLIRYKKNSPVPQIEDMTYGTFAKLPRTLTAEQLANAPRINCDDILRMKVPEKPRVWNLTDEIKKHKANLVHPAIKRPAKRGTGSTSGLPFTPEYLDSFQDTVKKYKTLAYACMDKLVSRVVGQKRIVWTDLAIAMTIIAGLPKNKHDAMPTNRIKKVWNMLYELGIIERGFDAQRWAAIRNLLADCGVFDVVDKTYWHFNGEKRGRCMRWSMNEDYIINEEQGEASLYEVILVERRWRPDLVRPNVILDWGDVHRRLREVGLEPCAA
jgi:hypothetical protein